MKQVGVQTNIKAGVTGSVGAYTPIPPTPPSPPSNPSAIVSGAGTPEANGTYTYTTQFGGKPQYNKSGTDPSIDAISWDGSEWTISAGGTFAVYISGDTPAFPWLVATWINNDGDDPVPVVTMGS